MYWTDFHTTNYLKIFYTQNEVKTATIVDLGLFTEQYGGFAFPLSSIILILRHLRNGLGVMEMHKRYKIINILRKLRRDKKEQS